MRKVPCNCNYTICPFATNQFGKNMEVFVEAFRIALPGHEMIQHAKVPMYFAKGRVVAASAEWLLWFMRWMWHAPRQTLDAISGAAPVLVMVGLLLLQDLRQSSLVYCDSLNRELWQALDKSVLQQWNPLCPQRRALLWHLWTSRPSWCQAFLTGWLSSLIRLDLLNAKRGRFAVSSWDEMKKLNHADLVCSLLWYEIKALVAEMNSSWTSSETVQVKRKFDLTQAEWQQHWNHSTAEVHGTSGPSSRFGEAAFAVSAMKADIPQILEGVMVLKKYVCYAYAMRVLPET